ncbi:helix-turn-helix transcriptional regulator [Microbacterium sp. NPDC008134]|uniref:helix-turn-helix transcriptional regulator n=1 Tax=Microbacterium sp. NPDC008134 TaxID=3364183 RepID=UPI0036E81A2E
MDPQRFHFDWSSTGLGSLTLVRYDLAAEVHSLAEPEHELLVCRVDASSAEVGSGREAMDASQPWLTDGARVEARWLQTARVRALVIDRGAAQARVRQITGDDSLVLRSTGLMPRDAASGRHWERTVEYLEDAVADLPPDGILRAELERHALAVTLSSFPTTVHESMSRTAQRGAAPAAVRRALAFIDENAHRAITIDDVAVAAFISTRGLQYAFRRALDATPAEYLRRARLAGAHRELVDGTTDSIAVVARRWGFSHPSRFAASYRREFGQAPSATAAERRR